MRSINSTIALGLTAILLFSLAIIPFTSSTNRVGYSSYGLSLNEVPLAREHFEIERQPPRAFSCQDFDMGVQPNDASYVLVRNGNRFDRLHDRCTGANQLLEYACGEQEVRTVPTRCEYGCRDGACQPESTTSITTTASCIQAGNEWVFQSNNSQTPLLQQGPFCHSLTQPLVPRCDAQNMTTYIVQNCPQNTVCHNGICRPLSSFPIDPTSISIPQQGWGPVTSWREFNCYNTDYNVSLGNNFTTQSPPNDTAVHHFHQSEIFTPGMRFFADPNTGVVETTSPTFAVDTCQDAGTSVWITEYYCIEAPNGTHHFAYPHAYSGAYHTPCPTACVTGPVVPGSNLTMDYCI